MEDSPYSGLRGAWKRSAGEILVDSNEGQSIWLVAVKGLGVMLLRATWNVDRNAWEFNSIDTFTKDDIGHVSGL